MSNTNGAVLTPEAQSLARLTDYDASDELGFGESPEETLEALAYHPDLGAEPLTADPETGALESEHDAIHASTPTAALGAAVPDPDDEEEIDPRSVKTKVGLVNSPWSRGLLIAGGVGAVFLVLGLFLHSVTTRRDAPPPVPTASASLAIGSDEGAALDETSKYKTEAALTTQKTALNQVAPKPSPSPIASPVAAPTALKPALAPPISNISLAPLTPMVPLSPLASTSPTASPDPVQQWQTAARMGSYGRLALGGSSSFAAPSTPNAVAPPAPFIPTPVASTSNGALPLTSLRASSSTPGLRDQPLSSVLVGSTAAAQLATAIVMAGDNSTPVAPDSPSATRYLIKLTADLKDADGKVALPSGSQVVIVARTFSQQGGSAEFVATSVLVNNKEYAVPKDALVVRSTNGGLLAFNKEKTGAGLFQSILPAFFAGIAQGGQILNQPTSTSSVSGGNVSATTSSSSPSAAAGFIQGFGQNLSQQMQQQAQAANQLAASKPAFWSLSAGSSVLVFVNSSFQL